MNHHAITNDCIAMPVYQRDGMDKAAVAPVVVAGASLLWKAYMAYLAAKGAYDIGTKNIPGMVREGVKGNWRGVGKHALGAGANALYVLPGMGIGGKLLSGATAGGKFLQLGGSAAKLHNAAKATGVGGRMASGFLKGVDYANKGVTKFMQSGMGQRMQPALAGVERMRASAPRWVMDPAGWKDTGKFMGASMGMSMGSEMLDPSGGSYRNLPIQHKTGPFVYGSRGLRGGSYVDRLRHAARDVGPTPPMRYRL